ncbi:efflux transporter outer membrane subunit [Cupriavidus sp. SW-Y-13]|uniref:efflux transporter outer membrane subunit n=1 Tax=Cupriavidus sp. SW-Y-13 TaxID=2653854 RepID=UPI001365545C|nr:efflux transporter outer membrane subunit [Cupriavidus sp. SW-Y-13]MWL89214.1 efflux transporter outer membrane subunit [Cupriavidus sp. SW-Y-13]
MRGVLEVRCASLAAVALTLGALAGCAGFGDARPTRHLAAVSGTAHSLPAMHGQWPAQDWADQFGDPQLGALTREAVAGSPTLQAALARLASARALADGARSGLYPEIGIQGGFTRERISETDTLRGTPLAGRWVDQAQLSGALSYDLDFWGRHRAELQAALSGVSEAEAEAESAKLVLTTGVARVYTRLATLYALRDVTTQTIDQRRELATLGRERLVAGLDTQVGTTLQDADLAGAEADLTRLDDDIAVARHQIAALLGKGPDRGLAIARPVLLSMSASQPVARLPDDAHIGLLSRRPDLVAARWRVEAASKDIEVARTAFLPDVTLNAMAGLTTITPADFLLGASRAFAFGPSLHLPVFEGGRLRADLHGRYAAYDAAVADYNQTLIQALRDTADTVDGLQSTATEIAQRQQALQLADHAYQLAARRWQAGLVNQLAVLAAQSELLARRRDVAQLQGQRLDLQFRLIWTLGGGYEGHPPVASLNEPASANTP